MNEKEFNLAILAELKRIAKEVFAKVTINKAGTYTAAELWNEKDAFGERILLFYGENQERMYVNYGKSSSDIYTAKVVAFEDTEWDFNNQRIIV